MTSQPTSGATLVKQAWAHSGTAVEATGAQSDLVAAAQDVGGSELVGPGSSDDSDDSDDSLDGSLLEPGGLVVLLTLQGVVGLAVTQSQSALTEPMT